MASDQVNFYYRENNYNVYNSHNNYYVIGLLYNNSGRLHRCFYMMFLYMYSHPLLYIDGSKQSRMGKYSPIRN